MNIHTFICNPYSECTYLVYGLPSEPEANCYIIDPGMYTDKEKQLVLTFIQENRLEPKAVLITHKHPDHVCGLEYIQNLYPTIPVMNNHSEWMNMPCERLLTPGHKEDAVCFYFKEASTLFSGDTLFLESVGRTDLPGGDFETLKDSIHTLISTLPDDTTVYPGHGPKTTIAHEKQYNPFYL